MNAWAFAVVLALAVATCYAGNLGLGLAPVATGVISTRVIAAPTLVAAPVPLLHSGLVAAPLSHGIIGTRTLIGAPFIGHLGATPLAHAPIW